MHNDGKIKVTLKKLLKVLLMIILTPSIWWGNTSKAGWEKSFSKTYKFNMIKKNLEHVWRSFTTSLSQCSAITSIKIPLQLLWREWKLPGLGRRPSFLSQRGGLSQWAGCVSQRDRGGSVEKGQFWWPGLDDKAKTLPMWAWGFLQDTNKNPASFNCFKMKKID